jgi:Flp pilus assembly protein TadD
MIRRDEEHQDTPSERARVAAELLQEAQQLTERAMLGANRPASAPPKPRTGPAATGNGHAAPNGNGHRKRSTYHNQLAHDIAAAGQTAAERMLAELNTAVTGDPESIDLLLHRATHLGSMGRYGAARGDLEQALSLDPENTTVRSALGIVLLRKGLWAQAVPHLRHVVEVESWSPTAWFYLGEALNHVDDLDGALAAFGRAVELAAR